MAVQLHFTIDEVSNLLNTSISRLQDWIKSGRLIPMQGNNVQNYVFTREQLQTYEPIRKIFDSKWDEELTVVPNKNRTICRCRRFSIGV
ncbi:MAG: helix-turn-helix domain-containing protein [Rikenellaceae bacterium]